MAANWSSEFVRNAEPSVCPQQSGLTHGSNNNSKEDAFLWQEASHGSWHFINHQ